MDDSILEDMFCEDEMPARRQAEELELFERYKKYVGKYAKRFYTPFEEENIHLIIDSRINEYGLAMFKIRTKDEDEWEWDIDDCVIITSDLPIVEDERVANVHDKEYNGYNPFKTS